MNEPSDLGARIRHAIDSARGTIALDSGVVRAGGLVLVLVSSAAGSVRWRLRRQCDDKSLGSGASGDWSAAAAMAAATMMIRLHTDGDLQLAAKELRNALSALQ